MVVKCHLQSLYEFIDSLILKTLGKKIYFFDYITTAFKFSFANTIEM